MIRPGTVQGLHEIPFGPALLLFREADRELFLLNETGVQIWREWQQNPQSASVASLLSQRFSIPLSDATQAVDEALEQWTSSGLFSPPATPQDPVLVPRPDPTARRNYRIAGQSVTVLYSSDRQEQRIHPRISHLEATASPHGPSIQLVESDQGYAVYSDGAGQPVDSAEEATGLFFVCLMGAALPKAHWILQLHAAGLTAHGRTILLAGRKGRGKTTLALALGRQGFRYLSDDLMLVDQDFSLVPVPLLAGVKEGSWSVLEGYWPELTETPVHQNSAGQVKYVHCSPQSWQNLKCPAQAILVFPKYQEGAPLEGRRLDPFGSLQRIVSEESWLSLDVLDIPLWTSWLLKTPSYELRYSDLQEATDWLGDLA